jgi:hypothetical protein
VKHDPAPARRRPDPATELEKLSSLTIAAGHDCNDELTFILNHAEASIERLGAGHPASADLIELQISAMRCAELIRGLLRITGRARAAIEYATVKSGDAHPGNRNFL